MDKSLSQEIIAAVKTLADEIAPTVRYVAKYGGDVFAMNPDDDKQFVGGVFAYKDHVSVEFSNGASFDDPKGYLEGGGKMRRHLKLHDMTAITDKGLASFLKQAFA